AVQALAFLPLIAAAVRGVGSAGVLFASAVVYWGAGMAAATAWNAWVGSFMPGSIRGRYFGVRQSLMQLGVLAGLVGGGVALHLSGGSPRVFAGVFGVAMLCRAVSSRVLAAKDRRAVRTAPPARRSGEVLRMLRGHGRAVL